MIDDPVRLGNLPQGLAFMTWRFQCRSATTL
jgi:hypothetical protein